MLLAEVTQTWAEVADASSRLAKVERLAGCLRRLAPAEIEPAVAFLSGELRQRQIGVGWAALRDLPPPAALSSLSVADVDGALTAVGARSGSGSQADRRRMLADLFARAGADEQRFLRALLLGELRQGAGEGVMIDAVARAGGVVPAEVRRALLLRGDLRAVARAALARGTAGLAEFRLRVGQPLRPMLAQPAADLAGALDRVSPAGVEEKLDGVRIQVHRDGRNVAVFTRSLDDITARVPEVVDLTLGLPVRAAVLDGEALALRPDGRPHPFQVTAGRVGTRTGRVGRTDGTGRAGAAVDVPLRPVLFDALHLDGADLLDLPAADRVAALARLVPADHRVRRVVTDQVPVAAEFLAETLRRGHEGVVVKSLDSPYLAGRRGAGWLKVKPRHTLDLVVLAAEWGHGRRRGWLSNLHLGARGPNGGFVMLGKTFKGLTDAMLAWQTERLLELATSAPDHPVVRVRPELVVEVAFDGVQTSPRYPGGVALRFARVIAHRPDKTAAEADPIDTVLAIHAAAPGDS
ncbi:MAG TPA: ATP-dependent DNA ligase [Mycobacteriales bacterium]|nr:ATP-dependent DNA ligase [Mycobacteriales bacterium]